MHNRITRIKPHKWIVMNLHVSFFRKTQEAPITYHLLVFCNWYPANFFCQLWIYASWVNSCWEKGKTPRFNTGKRGKSPKNTYHLLVFCNWYLENFFCQLWIHAFWVNPCWEKGRTSHFDTGKRGKSPKNTYHLLVFCNWYPENFLDHPPHLASFR